MTGNSSELWDRTYRIQIYDPQRLPRSSLVNVNETVPLDLKASVANPEGGNLLDLGSLSVANPGGGKENGLLPARLTVANMALSAPKLDYAGYYDDHDRPGLFAKWKLSGSVDEHAPSGTVSIANLDREDIAQIKRGDWMTLDAGYRRVGMQQLVLGAVTGVDPAYKRADRFTEIALSESKTVWMTTMAWREGKPNDRATNVVSDLLDQLPIPFLFKRVGKERVYRYGKTYDQNVTVMRALSQLAADTESKVYVHNGRAFFEPLNAGEITDVFVSNEPPFLNLIGEALPVNNEQSAGKETARWRVRMLLDGRVKPSSVFRIKSPAFTGQLRAISVQHVADMKRFYTIVDCAVHLPPEMIGLRHTNDGIGWLVSEGKDRAINGASQSLKLNVDDLVDSSGVQQDVSPLDQGIKISDLVGAKP